MTVYTYNTISQPGSAEYKDRGSRFLGYALPVSDIPTTKARLQETKKAHPKATHHCFAYRLGTDGMLFRASDAGEPSGSAGRPILGQIDRLGVTDVLVIVVRYFGGTLLGIPGLMEAYKTSAALALQTTPLITLQKERRYRIGFDYTAMDAVLKIIRQHQGTVYRQDAQLFCELEAGIPLAEEGRCLEQLHGMGNLDIVPVH